MMHRLLSLLTLTAGLTLSTTAAHAADYDEVTEGALLMTQDNVTVTATVTRDGKTTSLSNGNKAKVDEALTLEITPNVGYYFDDYTATAKTYPLTVTRDMLTVVNYDDEANYYDATGTWTALSTDDSYQNGLRTSGWKVALPYGETGLKITTTVTATGVLSFEYATNIGRNEYGGYTVNLLVNGKLKKMYTDFQNLTTTDYNLVGEEKGISVEKGQTLTWVFNNANQYGVKRDDVYGYIGNVKLTEPEFDIRDYVSGLYTVVRGYPLQMNVDTATVSVTTTRSGETLTLSENSTVFLGETLTVNYTPTGKHRYADTTYGTRTFDVTLTDKYLNTDAYSVDFNSENQFSEDLGDWTFNTTLPSDFLYEYWIKGKTNCWTVEIPCSSTASEGTKRITATMPFDGTLSYEYSFADFAVSSADCNYYRLLFYRSEENYNNNAYNSYSDFYGVSNPTPRTVTKTAGVKNGATVYWEYYYAGSDNDGDTGYGYLGNVRLTSDGSIDLRRSYPTTYDTFLPLTAGVEGYSIGMYTKRDGEDVDVFSGDLVRPNELIHYFITSVGDYVKDFDGSWVALYGYGFYVNSSMRDSTYIETFKPGSGLTALSGTWSTINIEESYQGSFYREGMKAPLPVGDFTAKSLQASIAADGVLTYILGVNNAGKFAEYGAFDVAVYVNGTQQKTYREFKDAWASDAETYSFVEPGIEVKKGDVVRWEFTRLTDGSDTEAPEMYAYLGSVNLHFTEKKLCYNANSVFPALRRDFTLTVPTDTLNRCTPVVTVVRDGETVKLTSGDKFHRYEQLTLTLTLDDIHCWDDNQGDRGPKTFTYDASVDYVPSAIRDTINAYYGRIYCYHSYNNGICTRCGYYAKPTTLGSTYLLGNAGDVLYFSDYVNGKIDGTKHPATDAYVVDDIDLTGIDYTPIGDAASDAYFSGSILYSSYNTREYTITLDLKGGDYTGFISVAKGATINNLTIAGAVTGSNNVGAFVGKSLGVTINNCKNKATVQTNSEADNDCAGGFVGLHKEGTLTITHCENNGSVSAKNGAGGFVGKSTASATGAIAIDHCVNHAKVYSQSCKSHFIGVITDGTATITSCYNSSNEDNLFVTCQDRGLVTLTTCYNVNDYDTTDGLTPYTAEQAASGELCFKLNNCKASFSDDDMNYWTQRIGSESLPTLIKDSDNKGRTVNKVTVTRLKYGADPVDEAVYCNTDNIVLNSDPTTFCILKSADESERVTNVYIDFNLNWGVNFGGYNTLVHTPNYKDTYYCPNACLVDTASYDLSYGYRAVNFSYQRTLKSTGYSTFILPVSVDASAVNGRVYKLSAVTDGTLVFDRVEGTVEANTPHLIYTSEDSLSLLNTSLSNVDVQAMTPVDLTVTSSDGSANITHRGTYVEEHSSAANYPNSALYGYSRGKFWLLAGRYALKPFRTMLEVTSTDAAVRPSSLIISIDGEVSGIVTPDLESTPVDVYSLDGRLLRTAVPSATALRDLPRGVYIVGGKKVIKR